MSVRTKRGDPRQPCTQCNEALTLNRAGICQACRKRECRNCGTVIRKDSTSSSCYRCGHSMNVKQEARV